MHSAQLKEVHFFLIEEKFDLADCLEAQIAQWKLPSTFVVAIGRGEFAKRFAAVLDRLEQNGLRSAPAFASIEPSGHSGLPYVLLARLLSHQKCEVLITFRMDALQEWLTSPDAGFPSLLTETFGTADAADLSLGPEPADALKRLYLSQLKKLSRFVRCYEMRGPDHRVASYMFFASSHSHGHQRVKRVIWKAARDGYFSFADATDAAQAVSLENPKPEDLAAHIVAKFRGVQKLAVARIEAFVDDDTAYLREHLAAALNQLERSALLTAEPVRSDGKTRMAETYWSDVLVSIR